MSYNGNGVFLINTPGQPVVSGTTITSTAFNALTTDLASGLTNAITKDGQTNITANIPMSNFKITGLGAGTNPNDAVRLAQIQDGIINGRFVNLEYTGTFTGGTGVVNLGSGQFYKDASGNVGFGTNAPAAKIDLSTGSGRKLNVYNDTTNAISGFGIDLASAGYELSCFSGGNGTGLGTFTWLGYNRTTNTYSERMRLDSSGNLGIGTISPSYRLAVKQSGNTGSASLGVSSINSANDTFVGIGYDSASDTNRVLASFISTGAFKPISFWTSDQERMRIDSSGNVGINSTTPQYRLSLGSGAGKKLAVYDDGISASNASGLGIDLSGAGNELSSWVGTTAGGAGQFTWGQVNTTSNAFAEKMRLDGSGNLSIAVTSAIGRLNVRSDNAATAIVAGNVSGTAAYNGALLYNNITHRGVAKPKSSSDI
jgi:hypothetical protein